jgi:hypothetical protein
LHHNTSDFHEFGLKTSRKTQNGARWKVGATAEKLSRA